MRLALGTRFLLASAGLVGLFFSAATPVHAGPATERMREFFGTVNTILNDPATRSRPLERVARVKRLVTDIADVRGAAAAALEHEWDVRTPAERDEFTRLFAELLERGLVARLAGTVNPVNGILMTWQGETRVNDEARVATVVESRDGRKIIVVYRMTERRGRWLVRDVVVDGISTTDNYRSQFKRVLRQGSYATLVAQLRAKLGEETLMFAQASPVPKPVGAAALTSATTGAAPTPPASEQRVTVVAMTPVVLSPAAEAVSPLSLVAMSTGVLPSALLVVLGFAGVSGAVCLRRRAAASALVLQRLRDTDKHLVLLHPVPRVAKVREGRRKRRVLPPPRNPARHVDDAHGA